MAIQFNPTVRGDALPVAPATSPNTGTRQVNKSLLEEKTQQDESQTHALNMVREREELRGAATFNLQNHRVGTLLNVKA